MSRPLTLLFKVILPIALIAGGVSTFVHFKNTKPVEKPKPVAERVWNVSAIEVNPGAISPKISVFGSLLAAREVELRSLVAGEVIKVGESFRDGGFIKSGELLVEIDPFSYEAALDEKRSSLLEAKARLEELEATNASDRILLDRDLEILELEERNLARSEKLRKKGNISDKSLDAAQTSLSRQKQQVAQRRSQLNVMDAKIGQQKATIQRMEVSVRVAMRDLENTRLVAPFDGYVSEVSAELGKRLDARDKVAQFLEADQLEARFHLSNRQYGVILKSNSGIVGRPITAIWKAGDKATEFKGRVDRVGSTITANTGGIEVFAVLDKAPEIALVRSGAFVEILLNGETYDQAVSVPDFAVFDNMVVYVAKEGVLEKRDVQVLFDNGDTVVITGNLKKGDKLVTTRFAEIGPGMRVEIR
ncbi:efflux RND transporter periplasmic adaptor subunit [Sneathiella sp. P13V-1]|uniref:efflux RND transporter periplasmic adaptor subunit n=1 Tax=Sneathiella sp. P13V-1 TaxID=2697366 RepID=UPI00187B75DB|nr:efflux RND transporter periplasmic adaptor subunit [Sneathiella sp. P13V-1]MBE7635618.1 efflux RND transporter periplasmic adaptor subunit [Sneathiella sp. P13V-1]